MPWWEGWRGPAKAFCDDEVSGEKWFIALSSFLTLQPPFTQRNESRIPEFLAVLLLYNNIALPNLQLHQLNMKT